MSVNDWISVSVLIGESDDRYVFRLNIENVREEPYVSVVSMLDMIH